MHVELLKQLGPHLYDADMDQQRARLAGPRRARRRARPPRTSRSAAATAPGSPRRSATTSWATGRSSRSCATPTSPRSWSTASTASSWRRTAGWCRPRRRSPTRPTCVARSTRSSPGSVAASTSPSPMVDARLPDGSRVNAVVPPLAVDGSALTIRKFATDPLTVDDLISFGSLSPSTAAFLDACVRGRLNIIVSGSTGAGKTTTLNVLSSFIPADERIVTIEDAAELQLKQDHVVRLESRPGQHRGQGRGHHPRPGEEQPAHAPRPDHRRRGPRRLGARHAAGDEHRPRRLHLHPALQRPPRHPRRGWRRWC